MRTLDARSIQASVNAVAGEFEAELHDAFLFLFDGVFAIFLVARSLSAAPRRDGDRQIGSRQGNIRSLKLRILR